MGVLVVVVLALVVVLHIVVVFRVDDFLVDVTLVLRVEVDEVVFGVLLEVDLGGVGVGVLQVVLFGQWYPTHLDDVVLMAVVDLNVEEDVGVGVGDGEEVDDNSGGSQGSVDSRVFAT